MQSFTCTVLFLSLLFLTSLSSPAVSLLSSNTVPSFPVGPDTEICHLDLSDELFGGVNDACGGANTLDRSRCCPVLAAWLFAAHARTALRMSPAPAPSDVGGDLPMMPDDSQKCVESLKESLRKRSIMIPQPNASCDAVMCFCGIRLHHISSLSCPAAFNVSGGRNHDEAPTPTPALLKLENNCRNSSYAGCTKCLAALQKLKGNKQSDKKEDDERAKKMFKRDCQMMGLTWLLGKNKTEYIPTVSAVLRAIMYTAHPHQSKCSPDHQNMPLAVDSLQLDKSHASSHPFTFLSIIALVIPLSLITTI